MGVIHEQIIDGYTIPELQFVSILNAGVHQRNYDYLYRGFNYCYSIRNEALSGVIASATPGTTYEEILYRYYPTIYTTHTRELTDSYTYNGKTVYYRFLGISPIVDRTNDLPLLAPVNTEFSYMTNTRYQERIAWAMIYGDATPDGYQVTYDLQNCTGSEDNPEVIQPNATITSCNFTKDSNYEFVSSSCWIDGQGFPEGSPVVFAWEPETGYLRIGPITSDITVHVHAYGDPYEDIDGESDIPGGDSVDIPGLPDINATSTGVLGLFAPSSSQMQQLSDYMWTDFGGTGTTEVDVLKEIVQAIKRAISNPLDYVTGLNIIPSQGLSIGSSAEIKFGFTNSGVSMPRLTSQYFTVNCGTLFFDTLCGDTFLDYAPYSKFSIYLPYIGVKEVDANDFVGHTIGVIYHGDVITGGVTAYITKDGSVMYQYSGCCALNVPLSADSWGTTISGAVQIATSMISAGITGGAAGVSSAAALGAASVAANPSLLSPQVAHSGAVSGGAGCMGVQYPFVIREAVRFHSTAGFQTISGYPSYYYKSLGDVSGYTLVLDVHLRNIPATESEINEIERILKGGAVF